MLDAISTALSGLVAQKTRIDASASNIANALTDGKLPTPSSPNSTVYKPLQTTFSTVPSGGGSSSVIATVTPDENGYTPAFDPTSPNANADGVVAQPNVDFGTEFVNITESKLAFKADLSVIKTQDEMAKSLLDIIT